MPLRTLILKNPKAAELPNEYGEAMRESLRYLGSPEAVASVENDIYWPKWNSPWWHLQTLHEMGEVQRAPETIIKEMVRGLEIFPVKFFPIFPEEWPPNVTPADVQCHCAVGNMYQILSAWGVDVDKKVPWFKPWFTKYQMKDGGLNCDETAYWQKEECPSSMVGVIAPFEALLFHSPTNQQSEELIFLDRAANFLIERRLTQGSATKHNAAERTSAKLWPQVAFPRFYFYDSLRGLYALLKWSEFRNVPLPAAAVGPVLEGLIHKFSNGLVHNERISFAETRTRVKVATGEWLSKQPATTFPLLQQVSEVGKPNRFLTKQFQECKAIALRLIEKGLLTNDAD